MIKGEVGSEFWDVPTCKDNYLFPDKIQWFLSGRSALQAIIRELKGMNTVAIPSWCCDSLVKPFVEAGIKVQFYPVYTKKCLIQEIQTDSDVLFLMDYFGYTSNITVSHPLIIRDTTHSVFSHAYTDADYYFGSLRKWCGVWTGGYAWTRDNHEIYIENCDGGEYIALRRKAMEGKSYYINSYLKEKNHSIADKAYLKDYEEAEELLEKCGISGAAERDIFLAQKLDVDFIRIRRRENAKVLMEAFPEWLIFHELNETDCPMFVPILVPNGKRDALRQYLIKYAIYCPIHWPESTYHQLDNKEKILYCNELSLVCDQRYTKEDMYRIVEIINNFWKGE